MPAELREQIEASWDGDPVQLYTLIDLDQSMRLIAGWLALGPEKVAVAHQTDAGAWDVYSWTGSPSHDASICARSSAGMRHG